MNSGINLTDSGFYKPHAKLSAVIQSQALYFFYYGCCDSNLTDISGYTWQYCLVALEKINDNICVHDERCLAS